MTIQISIAASSDRKPKEKAINKMKSFVDNVLEIEEDVIFLTGGGGGLMTLIAEEVNKKDRGDLVGVLPISMENISEDSPRWNPYNDVDIKTGMNFVARSPVLVNSGDVLVSLGGGVGTMIEVLMAYNLGVPAILITGTGYPTDKLPEIIDDGFIDHKEIVEIFSTSDPGEAASLVVDRS